MGAIEKELDKTVSRANFILEGLSARAALLERKSRVPEIYLTADEVRGFMRRPVPLPFGEDIAEPSSEAMIMIEARLDKLEENVSGIKSVLEKIYAKLEVIDGRSIRIEAQFPYLATKEDLGSVKRDLQIEIRDVKSELQLDIAKRPTTAGMFTMISAVLGLIIAVVSSLPIWKPWVMALFGK